MKLTHVKVERAAQLLETTADNVRVMLHRKQLDGRTERHTLVSLLSIGRLIAERKLKQTAPEGENSHAE